MIQTKTPKRNPRVPKSPFATKYTHKNGFRSVQINIPLDKCPIVGKTFSSVSYFRISSFLKPICVRLEEIVKI